MIQTRHSTERRATSRRDVIPHGDVPRRDERERCGRILSRSCAGNAPSPGRATSVFGRGSGSRPRRSSSPRELESAVGPFTHPPLEVAADLPSAAAAAAVSAAAAAAAVSAAAAARRARAQTCSRRSGTHRAKVAADLPSRRRRLCRTWTRTGREESSRRRWSSFLASAVAVIGILASAVGGVRGRRNRRRDIDRGSRRGGRANHHVRGRRNRRRDIDRGSRPGGRDGRGSNPSRASRRRGRGWSCARASWLRSRSLTSCSGSGLRSGHLCRVCLSEPQMQHPPLGTFSSGSFLGQFTRRWPRSPQMKHHVLE